LTHLSFSSVLLPLYCGEQVQLKFINQTGYQTCDDLIISNEEETKNPTDLEHDVTKLKEWGRHNMGPVADFMMSDEESMICAAGLAPYSALWEIDQGLNLKQEERMILEFDQEID
jgi:hypothetical protein